MNYNVSNTSLELFPVEPLYCLLRCKDNVPIEVPKEFVVNGKWGRPSYFEYNEPIDLSMPEILDVLYISIIEKKAYRLDTKIINRELSIALEKDDDTKSIVIGLGPYGIIAIWNFNTQYTSLVGMYYAEECDVPVNLLRCNSSATFNTLCQNHIETLKLKPSILDKLNKNIVLKSLKQYLFKFNILFTANKSVKGCSSNIDSSIIKSLRANCFDGSFDYKNDGNLSEYHFSGLPKNIFIEWKSILELFYGFIVFEYEVCAIIDRFYGAHPETKTDFIIRIDAENKKYELALYRQGLKEPVVIPESAYQLIVFKNKFEDYRSENYNQPRGAWIW